MPRGALCLVLMGPVAGLRFQEGILTSKSLLLVRAVVLPWGHKRLGCQNGTDKLIWGDLTLSEDNFWTLAY